ncbi:MAG: hypothetical protein MR420_02385 [Spirochaetia bacterium]|nr:hypothetical protein [Spirochaetia bacterium]
MRDSKPRNNALHAFCGIETIELPLRSSHKKSVFEPRPAPSHQHYGKAFIMRKPCSTIHFNSSFFLQKLYLFTCSLARTFCKSSVVETTCGLQN